MVNDKFPSNSNTYIFHEPEIYVNQNTIVGRPKEKEYDTRHASAAQEIVNPKSKLVN